MKGHDTMGKDLKGKELGKGLSQRKDGKYSGRFVDRFGKRTQVYGSTLKEVKNKIAVAVADNEKMRNVVEPNTTLDQWYEKWMRVYKIPVIRPNSKRHYESVYTKHIKPYLGNKRLTDITKLMITDTINQIYMKGYQWETLNKIRVLLIDMLDRAMEDNLLVKNPTRGVRLPINKPQNEVKALTREDQKAFFECSAGTFYYNLFVVAINTGLRPGDDDDKIRLNQRKPSKYKGLSRFGPEKNLQRINKFMKERPTFYKKLIQMKENFRFYLRCFYCITKVVILQFNSEKQDRISS